MRRALAIFLATAALAGCGDDDDDNGGATPGASINVTGANTFTATNAIGFSTGNAVNCTIEGVEVSTSLMAVFATDVAGDVCTLVNSSQEKRGAGSIGFVVARANVTGGTAPTVGAGTYSITSSGSLPIPDASGNVTFVSAFAAKNAPGACGAVDVEAESGTITITSVSGGVIRGSINANLAASGGGGTISGNFTSAACAVPSNNVCGTIIDDSPDACVD